MATRGAFDETDITDPIPREEIEMQDMNEYVNTKLEHDLYFKDLNRIFQELSEKVNTELSVPERQEHRHFITERRFLRVLFDKDITRAKAKGRRNFWIIH